MTDQDRIDHIVESIERIEEFVSGLDKDKFLRDEKVKYACYANLIVLSEAAARLSKEYREWTKEIEWSLIIGFRNIIIHEYFRIDWNIVWDVIDTNLPQIKKELVGE